MRRGTAEDSVTAVAGLVWAPLAAGIALLINIPIRGFVERPRPFRDHQGLDVLVDGKNDFSFVSDHATMAMALGVGLFVANRKFGIAAIALALLEGFCRIYMGVHYPTDVIGGFALGTAAALLLAPLAMMLLTPLVGAVSRSGQARQAGQVAQPARGDGRGRRRGARDSRAAPRFGRRLGGREGPRRLREAGPSRSGAVSRAGQGRCRFPQPVTVTGGT